MRRIRRCILALALGLRRREWAPAHKMELLASRMNLHSRGVHDNTKQCLCVPASKAVLFKGDLVGRVVTVADRCELRLGSACKNGCLKDGGSRPRKREVQPRPQPLYGQLGFTATSTPRYLVYHSPTYTALDKNLRSHFTYYSLLASISHLLYAGPPSMSACSSNNPWPDVR
jgi:hypothetical protein